MAGSVLADPLHFTAGGLSDPGAGGRLGTLTGQRGLQFLSAGHQAGTLVFRALQRAGQLSEVLPRPLQFGLNRGRRPLGLGGPALGVLRPADRLVPGLCRRGDLLAGSDVRSLDRLRRRLVRRGDRGRRDTGGDRGGVHDPSAEALEGGRRREYEPQHP